MRSKVLVRKSGLIRTRLKFCEAISPTFSKMLGNAATNRALRFAWNRFNPNGKPFIGILRNSLSTLSKQGQPGPGGGARSKLLSRPYRDVQSVSKRGIKQSAPKNDDNMIVIVGLGALGLATFVAVKSNIFTQENKPAKISADRVSDETRNQVASIEISEIGSETEIGSDKLEGEEAEMGKEAQDTSETEVQESLEEKATESEHLNKSEELVDEVTEQAEVVQEEGEPKVTEKTTDLESSSEPEKAPQEPSEEIVTEKQPEELEKTSDISTEDAVSVTEENYVPIELVNEKKILKDLPKIPAYAPYVIIGGGTASHAACRAIRKHDPTAKILVICDEELLPYMRPPLSKELWFSEDEDAGDTLFFKQWNGKMRSLFFEDDTYYVKPQLLPVQEKGGVAVLTGHKVTEIDPVKHVLQLKYGQGIQYDKLLIATGGYPRNLDLFAKAPDNLKSKITLFRTVADYRKLDKLVNSLDSVAIVGGGFLGSELACALGSKGKKTGMEVSQIYHENGNMGKVLPNYLSEWTTRKVQNEGVKTFPNAQLVDADITGDDKVSIKLSNGEKVDVAHVIVCVGIEPNTDLARTAGLEVDPEHGGFRVNSELQARSDIWVAGDAACFYDVRLGRRRVEHHDHAVVSGRLAGENMTGGKKAYLHQSMFWSDLGPEVGYEAIGIVDNSLDTVGIWAKATKQDSPKAVVEATGDNLRSQTEEDAETGESIVVPVPEGINQEDYKEDYGKGVVFYLKDQVVVGVLLWNVFNKMPIARRILKEGKKQDSLVELAKLFNIHEK